MRTTAKVYRNELRSADAWREEMDDNADPGP
jgi:hypothetical protein